MFSTIEKLTLVLILCEMTEHTTKKQHFINNELTNINHQKQQKKNNADPLLNDLK